MDMDIVALIALFCAIKHFDVIFRLKDNIQTTINLTPPVLMHLQQQTTHQPNKVGDFAHNMVFVCATSNKCASDSTDAN